MKAHSLDLTRNWLWKSANNKEIGQLSRSGHSGNGGYVNLMNSRDVFAISIGQGD
jgi:hypothetical protein